MEVVFKTYNNTPGFPPSIGKRWRPRSYNPLLFLMCVTTFLALASQLTFPQIKQANFDVTHELDEFLMVEKPLTHTKRKANADLDKLKPELRQLEEQFVSFFGIHPNSSDSIHPSGLPFTISADQNACHIIRTINQFSP